MTDAALLLLGIGVAVAVGLGLLALYRRQKRAVAVLAADLGGDELVSGVTYDAVLEGVAYRYEYFAGTRGRPPDFKVSVECLSNGEFEVGRETRSHRFFKRLGISSEIQTGDAAFDERFYLRSDSVAFSEHYFRSAARREGVSRVFDLGYGCLGHDGEWLVATLTPFDVKKDRGKLALESVVGELALLAKDPPRDYYEPLVTGRPAWKLKRLAVYATSIAAAAVGVALTVWGQVAFTPLDGGAVVAASLEYSLPAFLAFAGASIVLLKGRSASHTDLMTNLLIALIGLPLLGYGTLVTFNGWLDEGASSSHRAAIVGKRISAGKSKSYYVSVASWRDGRDREELRVGRAEYDRMQVGATLQTTTKPGRFGFEWLVDYRLVDPPGAPPRRR